MSKVLAHESAEQKRKAHPLPLLFFRHARVVVVVRVDSRLGRSNQRLNLLRNGWWLRASEFVLY